jgi:hypothetical protein
VQTGIALVQAKPNDGLKLLEAAEALAHAFKAISAKPANPWIKVTIPQVPISIRTLTDDFIGTTLREVTESELATEVAAALSVRAAKVTWAASNDINTNTRYALVAFHLADAGHIISQIKIFSTPLPVHFR